MKDNKTPELALICCDLMTELAKETMQRQALEERVRQLETQLRQHELFHSYVRSV